MRWLILFIILLAGLLWWTGVITIKIPTSVTDKIPVGMKSDAAKLTTWVRSMGLARPAAGISSTSSSDSNSSGSVSSGSSLFSSSSSANSTSSAPAAPTTEAYENQGCAFQTPSDWTSTNNGNLLRVSSPDGKAFSVLAGTRPGAITADSAAFSNHVLSVATKRGFKIRGESREPFKGMPAYSFAGYADSDPALIQRFTSFISGTHIYILVLEKRNGDPSDDSQLLHILNSVTTTGD